MAETNQCSHLQDLQTLYLSYSKQKFETGYGPQTLLNTSWIIKIGLPLSLPVALLRAVVLDLQ